MSEKKLKRNDKKHKTGFLPQEYLSPENSQCTDNNKNKINYENDVKLPKKIKTEVIDSETNELSDINIEKKKIKKELASEEDRKVQKIKKKKKNIFDENEVFNNIRQEPIVDNQPDELYVKKEKKKKKKKDIESDQDLNTEMPNKNGLKLERVDPSTIDDEAEVKKNKKKKLHENSMQIDNLNSEECSNVNTVETNETLKKKKRKRLRESSENDLIQNQNLQEDTHDKVKKKKKRKHDIERSEDNESIKMESHSGEESVGLAKTEKKKKKKKSKKSNEQEMEQERRDENIDPSSGNIKFEKQELTEDVDKLKKKKKKSESDSTVNSSKENVKKSSKKEKKSSSESGEIVIEEKVKEFKNPKKTELNNKSDNESNSDNEINSNNSISSEESLREEEPKSNTIAKKIEEQRIQVKENISDSELSDEEDDEDYDEEETLPRKRRHKSIFEQHPKLAKIMTESDDERDELQYQQLNIRESKQLSDLVVKLIHHVLPQHNVEKTSGTRPLSKEEKERFEKYAPLKLGVYSSDEDNRIVHNWKKFCKVHDWKRSLVHPFTFRKRKGFYFISKVEERRKFVQFLAHGLPNRSLYSVFGRFKNLYGTHKQSRYTKEEDDIILKTINDPTVKHPQAVLAKRLNRTRQSVWRRVQKLSKESDSD
ncbi:myb-like protein X isoform X2 [Cotesia glomerata]|uniref:myb-like protein X isoform X2 n=1 Tax=Cotesia glomerata TaxID=32391 RepID=UPI001D0293E0|nr:myb-like protein X isoform X2 [Cotesia glomerata]